jgi:hypothetical protein
MDLKTDRVVAAIILVASFAIFRTSPMHPIADSRFEMMFSQQLLYNGSFSLDARPLSSFLSNRPIQDFRRGFDYPYQLERRGDRFYYWFPPGSTVLSIPYVAMANGLGISATDKDGFYNPRGETRIQAGLAALLMAGLTVIMYYTSRFFLTIGWSAWIATATALGTTVWSTASRSMWIHTWGIFVLGLVVWLIARAEVRRKSLHPIFLATCLSWLYFIRPSFALSIIGVAVYVLIRHPRAFLPLVVTGGAWLILFLCYSYEHFGRLSDYYQSQPHMLNFGGSFWVGLAGTLVSPSRGLLIYSPVLLFVAYLLWRYRSQLRPHLTWLALGIVVVHVVFMSAYKFWYGGHCYGPRYCTDVIPWFALLGVLGVEARQRSAALSPTRGTRLEWSVGLLLLGWSVLLNGIGGTSVNAWYWNVIPKNIDHDLSRLWDWKNPPFVQALKPRLDR